MFADRLIEATRKFGVLCVGIDPHPRMIPEFFGGDTAQGISAWGEAVIRIATEKVAVVKPQIALFERHGSEGIKAFERICKVARERGLLVIADAKRGDIGTTAKGYAEAFLSAGAPFECDALTINPYMGMDSLQPFFEAALENNKGVAVLVRTSNQGAEDFQSKTLDGIPLFLRVVEALKPYSSDFMGKSGWSGLMLVVGSTRTDEGLSVRTASPRSLFLVPGFGVQNSRVADALVTFRNGEGGIINASRSVTFSKRVQLAQDRNAWENAISEEILFASRTIKDAISIQKSAN